ncbi:hypothetical protein [Parasynechococcus sp.]|uniref:hypothetical protein n=1 Tax=Parasynechococcus sp. TaxID=3101203 RepID=UPI003703E7BC
MVVLARRIRGYAAMAKASSDCQVKKGRLPRLQRLLDDSCALDRTRSLKRFSWPKTNSGFYFLSE